MSEPATFAENSALPNTTSHGVVASNLDLSSKRILATHPLILGPYYGVLMIGVGVTKVPYLSLAGEREIVSTPRSAPL